MKLGVADDWFPGNINAITPALTEQIAEMGFTGVGAHFRGDPNAAASVAEAERIRSLLAAHNLEIVQVWSSYPSFFASDPAVRAQAISVCRGTVRLAKHVGAHTATFRPTSFHPTSPWWYHRDNYSPVARSLLIDALKAIAETCEEQQQPMALECHVTTTLSNAAVVREIIETIGSPWVRVNMDVVNFFSSIRDVWDSTAFLHRLFDGLGDLAVTAHIKDIDVLDGHVVHLGERPPGQGVLDFETFFRRFQAACPDGYGLIEHLQSIEQVRAANDFVRATLQRLSIPVDKGGSTHGH